MNELLLDNKQRICEIFQLDNNLPDILINGKIKNSSYNYASALCQYNTILEPAVS